MSCPMCQKETCSKYRPFCSKRCADIDLGKWLSESYVSPEVEETSAISKGELDAPSKPH